jgi:hypothetical protein
LSSKNIINSPSDSSIKITGWILVVLSSTLLGIWAIKETIALRNILLVIGILFSIYYIVQEWRYGDLKKQCTNWNVMPFLLLVLTFVWVVSHYLFFSVEPVRQFEELVSTWLRALMASIIGLATGLALRNHPNRLNLLWLGILIAFLVLFYQYIPRAISQGKLLVPDYDHYLFHLKFNTVLVGMILIAGVDGALLDHLRSIGYSWSKFRLWYFMYWLFATSLVLWAFVYIIDARNGIGLSIILYFFWFICTLVFFINSQMHRPNLKCFLFLLLVNIGLCLVLYFAYLQTTVNKGWHSIINDVKIAAQIDRYPHWQNPAQMGYPKSDDGQTVAPNTYERVAWAIAGSRAIIAYPQGIGVLAFPFAKHPNPPPKMVVGPNISGIATHSGWVELGLAFGIPILALILSILLLTFIEAARHAHRARMTVLGFVVSIFCLYTVGENSSKHGIEILFFLLALIPALLLNNPQANRLND